MRDVRESASRSPWVSLPTAATIAATVSTTLFGDFTRPAERADEEVFGGVKGLVHDPF